MGCMLGDGVCVQVGLVCADIEKTAAMWKKVLGTESYTQIDSAPVEIAQTKYFGQNTPATCKQGFFMLGEHVQLELIQPDNNPSTWRKALNDRGDSIHHIAFWVDDAESASKALKIAGISAQQTGAWEEGKYVYLDSENSLATMVELLQHVNPGTEQ